MDGSTQGGAYSSWIMETQKKRKKYTVRLTTGSILRQGNNSTFPYVGKTSMRVRGLCTSSQENVNTNQTPEYCIRRCSELTQCRRRVLGSNVRIVGEMIVRRSGKRKSSGNKIRFTNFSSIFPRYPPSVPYSRLHIHLLYSFSSIYRLELPVLAASCSKCIMPESSGLYWMEVKFRTAVRV